MTYEHGMESKIQKICWSIFMFPLVILFGVFVLFTFYFTLLPLISIFQLFRFILDRNFRESIVHATPEGIAVYFHRGHTWLKPEDGIVAVGPDGFASAIAGGGVREIEHSRVGTELKSGDPVWKFKFDRRAIEQFVPVGGTVIEVNKKLLMDPSLLGRSQAEDLWIVRIKPNRAIGELKDFLTLSNFRNWNNSVRDRIMSRYCPEAGAVQADGGDWAPKLASQLSDAEWEDLVSREFEAIN